jgi:hypothetical protein
MKYALELNLRQNPTISRETPRHASKVTHCFFTKNAFAVKEVKSAKRQSHKKRVYIIL